MTGEEINSIDFSFEEIRDVMGENVQDLLNDENIDQEGQPSKDENKTDTSNKLEGKEKETAKAAKDNKSSEQEEKIKLKKATTEDESSERVGGSADEKSESQSSPQVYQALTTVLKEQGVLSSVDESSLEKVEDIDSFVEIMKEQIRAEEFKDLTPQQKTVLEDMRAGVEPDTASKYKSAIDKLDSIDNDLIQENKQVRFDLIYEDFLAKGFSHEKAEKYAKRSFELNEDIKDAQDAKDSLKREVDRQYNLTKEKELEQVAIAQRKVEEEKQQLKERILKSPEVLEGAEVPENMRHEIYDLVSKIVSTNPDTKEPENELQKFQRENPVEYNHKLYYLYKVTNGFKDLKYFGRRMTSNSVKNLETALKTSTHVKGGGNPSFNDDTQSRVLDIGELVLPED